ncbi:unnamed protein product [Ilex paraguariensis]|uniref:Uncharacterized protein n=1 Tax=Ilex paraguariensis TaxID=185542 RepID=A0ABC8UPJ0_9AQUA
MAGGKGHHIRWNESSLNVTILPHNSMETLRRKSGSGDKFSFPIIPIQDQQFEFEFGCVTPGSPNSPADHLFFNGQLLPHPFPLQATNITGIYSRSTSRTSTVSSKDSLMSSRSNSTNSRSSSCSSARTSTSEASERKAMGQAKFSGKTAVKNRLVLNHQYGSSRRWQFITPAPVVKHQISCRKRAEAAVQDELRAKKEARDKTGGFGRRFFRSFVSACRECHAMNPPKRDTVLQETM